MSPLPTLTRIASRIHRNEKEPLVEEEEEEEEVKVEVEEE